MEAADSASSTYHCRVCRTMLFASRDVVSHPPPHAKEPRFPHRRFPDPSVPPAPEDLQGLQEQEGGVEEVAGEVKHGPATKKRNLAAASECTSYFVEPQKWMGELTEGEGKLCCPKCATRVGSWSWAGLQCSCGTWRTPAFQIPASKVDMKRSVIH